MEIGPVGFSLTAVTRRSCGRCAGVVGRPPGLAGAGCPGLLGRPEPGRPGVPEVGRVPPTAAPPLPGLLAGRGWTPALFGRCPCEAGRCWNGPPGCLCAGATVLLARWTGAPGLPERCTGVP